MTTKLRVLLPLCCSFFFFFFLATAHATPNTPITLTVKDLIHLRCSLDSDADTITTWTGLAYSVVPQQAQKKLFGVVGMNIAKCLQDASGTWYLTSRELEYYTDPMNLSAPLYSWTNPFTQEDVTVMHVANSPVQEPLGPSSAPLPANLLAAGAVVAVTSDILLYYPNPLAANASYSPYAPQPMYEGGEFFKFQLTSQDLRNGKPSVPGMWFTWERSSQWMPWMKMGDRPGGMFFSATGSRVASLADLPKFMQEDIATRLPLYAQAPPCMLNQSDSTSWTYFEQHFDAYLAGDRFPVPAPNATVPCQWKPT